MQVPAAPCPHPFHRHTRLYRNASMNTRTENRPNAQSDRLPEQPPTPAPRSSDPSERTGLSVAQIIGGSLAAATAAALGSRLGVVGTITGAALVSVVASLSGAVYTSSLRHTGDRVSAVLRTARGAQPVTGSDPRPARRVLVGAITVFALAAVAVTGFEALSGRSLDGSGGTTVGETVRGTTGGSTGGSGTELSPPPSGSPSRQTSPTTTATPPPTPVPSATPGETTGSEATLTGEPSPTASPSDQATSDSTPTAEPTSTGTSDPTGDGDAASGGSEASDGQDADPIVP